MSLAQSGFFVYLEISALGLTAGSSNVGIGTSNLCRTVGSANIVSWSSFRGLCLISSASRSKGRSGGAGGCSCLSRGGTRGCSCLSREGARGYSYLSCLSSFLNSTSISLIIVIICSVISAFNFFPLVSGSNPAIFFFSEILINRPVSNLFYPNNCPGSISAMTDYQKDVWCVCMTCRVLFGINKE